MTDTDENAEEKPGSAGFRAALGNRDFAWLWSGQALSSVGNQMFPVALSLLVLHRGGGATGLGVVLATLSVAVVAGTLAAAAFGDRWRRTRVMIAADVLRAVAVAALALSPSNAATAVLMIPVALVGFGEGFFQPAFAASVPRLLSEDLLQPGNGLNSMSLYVSMVVGPGLAGLLVALWGPGGAMWVDAFTFVFSIVTLLAVRETAMGPEEGEESTGLGGAVRKTVTDLREGVRAVVVRPWIGVSIGMATVIMMFVTAPALVLLPVVAEDRLGGSEAYGAVLVAMGIGSVIGALVGGRIRTRRPGVVALGCVATNAATVIGLAYLPLPGVVATWWLAGLGVTVFQVLWLTGIQKDVPDEVMGRVMALDWLGSQALMPIGYALTGPMVALVGERPLLVACAVLLFVVVPLPLLTRGGSTFAGPVSPDVGADPVNVG